MLDDQKMNEDNTEDKSNNLKRFLNKNRYSLYVLTLLMLTYMVNQCNTLVY